MNIEALRPHLNDELYQRISESLGSIEGLNIINTNDGSWIPKARFDEVRNETKNLKSQIATLSKDLNDAQTTGTDNTTTINALNARIAELQRDVETRDGQISGLQRASRVSDTVRKANARDVDLVLRLLDMDKIAEDEHGNITGLSEQLDALKQSSDYLFLDTGNRGGFSGGREPAMPTVNNNTAMNDAIRMAAGVK